MNQLQTVLYVTFISLISMVEASVMKGNETLARILNENKCGQSSLRRCARIADPILADPKLAFPADENELVKVCRSFLELRDCSRTFLKNCIGGPSMFDYLQILDEASKSANDICYEDSNQNKKSYLEHAVCLRSIVSDNLKCAKNFNELVTAVMLFDPKNSDVCCSHKSFRQCMIFHTKNQCERINPGASLVVQGIIDSALNFIAKQCKSVPNDCFFPKERETNVHFENRKTVIENTRQTTVKPWLLEQPRQQELHSAAPNLILERSPFLLLMFMLYVLFFN
ncbi:uncharacterized protein LOC136032889 [Artemia franciscana]|uniref:uncharacterized protein LOC136032889 n=1 Tax=Artemia franciscana TaxID=6661 RepID=UPI0032D9B31F